MQGGGGGGQRKGEIGELTETERAQPDRKSGGRERENSNSKTSFYKD